MLQTRRSTRRSRKTPWSIREPEPHGHWPRGRVGPRAQEDRQPGERPRKGQEGDRPPHRRTQPRQNRKCMGDNTMGGGGGVLDSEDAVELLFCTYLNEKYCNYIYILLNAVFKLRVIYTQLHWNYMSFSLFDNRYFDWLMGSFKFIGGIYID